MSIGQTIKCLDWPNQSSNLTVIDHEFHLTSLKAPEQKRGWGSGRLVEHRRAGGDFGLYAVKSSFSSLPTMLRKKKVSSNSVLSM